MRHVNPILLVITLTLQAYSSHAQDTLAKGAFILHKFQQPIGRELYSLVKEQDSLKLRSDFKFADRGQNVFLDAVMVSNKKGQPVFLKIKGSTSRFSVIDAEVRISNDSVTIRNNAEIRRGLLNTPYYTIGGYSPVAIQMQMLRYWKENGNPATLPVYPSGAVKIKFSGLDTLRLRDQTHILERYFVSGLIWGNEIIWTDRFGKLVALITNDAEGDKFEAVDEPFMPMLPELLQKAAANGMASFHVVDHQDHKKVLVLKNANLVDVIGGKSIPGSTIVIENGKITKVGEARSVRVPKGAK